MKLARYCRKALLLILLVLMAACAMAAARAEIVPSERKDDGVLRVLLRSLGAPEELTLTLDGVYTVEHDAGFRFERGAQIRLYCQGDSVWMDAGALSLDMGPALTLTRQAARDGEENGLRIAETERDNLYPGDLSVCAENGSLRPVLSIQVEDYLRGVVAYEMSDEWPIEALKAQAVAARTYALRAKANASKRDYDLVDTTADQVFRGVDAGLKRVAEAVRATAGVTGTYKGSFANCFYTASNGGETALPSDVWGDGGDYGYLARRADPYDLENERSKVTSAHFRRDASDLPALREMLEAALAEQPGAEGAEIVEIEGIEPEDPVAEGSIACSKLRFTLRAAVPVPELGPGEGDVGAPAEPADSDSGNLALYGLDYLRRLTLGSPYEPTGEQEARLEEFDVELDVYDQIKDGLELGLNSGDCEVVRVAEERDGYAVELRRYGHGVGMSQRGAQTMAGAHGMDFEEILAFYYPGMALERIEWEPSDPLPLDELPSRGGERPAPSPTPESAPLPEPDEGEAYARVKLDDAGSSMNLRQSPSTDAPVVALLYHNERVLVCGEADAQGWVRVKAAGSEGYAKLEYLKKE